MQNEKSETSIFQNITCPKCKVVNPPITMTLPSRIVTVRFNSNTNEYEEYDVTVEDRPAVYLCECGKEIFFKNGEQEDQVLKNITPI